MNRELSTRYTRGELPETKHTRHWDQHVYFLTSVSFHYQTLSVCWSILGFDPEKGDGVDKERQEVGVGVPPTITPDVSSLRPHSSTRASTDVQKDVTGRVPDRGEEGTDRREGSYTTTDYGGPHPTPPGRAQTRDGAAVGPLGLRQRVLDVRKGKTLGTRPIHPEPLMSLDRVS